MLFSRVVLFTALSARSAYAFTSPAHVPRRAFVSASRPASALAAKQSFLEKLFGSPETASNSQLTAVTTEKPTEEQIGSLFNLWNDALATGEPRLVAALYAPDAVLLPTVSDEPRTDKAGILNYFEAFLKKQPQGTILDRTVKVGDGWAKDVGIYEFTMGDTGDKVKARYSFLYTMDRGRWKIQHHHSSMMPEEAMSVGQGITDDQVKNLFFLWNDALATKDSELVAKRYSKNAVLLPTVSDTPRTDFEGIKSYFDDFLKLEPQGTILESHVTRGDSWCKDVGVYEFKLGASGATVKARYSFVYVYEDGVWKIAHHHSSAMPEESKGEELNTKEVQGLFNLWNDALATLDSDKVAKRYAKEGVLLPTVSDKPRTDYDSIKDYFDNFLKLKPQGEIIESYVTHGPNWAKDVGIYEFTLGASGDKVVARYSFVYTFEDGEWKISHHHSSAMPEASKGEIIEEGEAKKLFSLWNDALATLDSDKVAKRYAKEAVLLPTVSDTPRTDYASIKDYFDNFLQKKPQGVILESYASVGPNWCKDVGIYEFTMGDTGDKVKARYSFVYVYEDDEWKIAHHHSSVMPETYVATPTEEKQVTATVS